MSILSTFYLCLLPQYFCAKNFKSQKLTRGRLCEVLLNKKIWEKNEIDYRCKFHQRAHFFVPTYFFLVTFRLWRQNFVQKMRAKMLMKLTTGLLMLLPWRWHFSIFFVKLKMELNQGQQRIRNLMTSHKYFQRDAQ